MTEPTQFFPDPSLTAEQHRVLALLAEGNSIHATAKAVGVHRNTIRNWRRTNPAFARQAEIAVREQAVAWHDQALVLAPQATAVLNEILNDPKASQPLRARIAMTLFKMAADPKAKCLPLPELFSAEPIAKAEIVQDPNSENCTIMHNPAPLTKAA